MDTGVAGSHGLAAPKAVVEVVEAASEHPMDHTMGGKSAWGALGSMELAIPNNVQD